MAKDDAVGRILDKILRQSQGLFPEEKEWLMINVTSLCASPATPPARKEKIHRMGARL